MPFRATFDALLGELSCYRGEERHNARSITMELFCRECRSSCGCNKAWVVKSRRTQGTNFWLFRDDDENFTEGYSRAGDYLTIAISRTGFVSIERRNECDQIYLSSVYSLSDLIKRGERLLNFDFDKALWDPLKDFKLFFFLYDTRDAKVQQFFHSFTMIWQQALKISPSNDS